MRGVRSPAAVVAVLLVAMAAQPARADDAAAARELFNQGNTFFDLGQFDKAIDAWQHGYQLKNDPGFLYNIGQAYRTMGDPEKAIFFYKRYLINAPKAKNRPEVEQKIEALQKQVQERQAPPPGLATAPTAPPPAELPPAAASSPAVPPPAPATNPPPAQGLEPAPATTPEPIAPPPPAPGTRKVDLGAAIGFDAWTAGLRDHADPSFAFALQGGYTFGAQPDARLRFRLGAVFGYTFLKETGGTDSFTSLVIDPTLVVRVNDRVRINGDLGVGFVTISGLTPDSTLLIVPKNGNKLSISGSGVSRGLLRVGVGAEYDLFPPLSIFAWPAIGSSPKSGDFYGSLTRLEVLFGAAYRL
jgi:hypothetical protein